MATAYTFAILVAVAAVATVAAVTANSVVSRRREDEYRKRCGAIKEGSVYLAVPDGSPVKRNPFEENDEEGHAFQVLEKRFSDDGKLFVKYRFYFRKLDLYGSRTWVKCYTMRDDWRELATLKGSAPEVFEIHEALRDALKRRILEMSRKAAEGLVCYDNADDALGKFEKIRQMADELGAFLDKHTCSKEHKLSD